MALYTGQITLGSQTNFHNFVLPPNWTKAKFTQVAFSAETDSNSECKTKKKKNSLSANPVSMPPWCPASPCTSGSSNNVSTDDH